MSFDQRHRYRADAHDDELIERLAARYQLDIDLAQGVWDEALRAAADDAYRRSASDWVGRLAEVESGPAARPGRRTAVDRAQRHGRRAHHTVAPGRRTLTMREARALDAPTQAQPAEP